MNPKIKSCWLIVLVLPSFLCYPAWADEIELAWSTFLGGNEDEFDSDIATDSFGNAYVTGLTQSPDFPTTAGVFDTAYNGGYSDLFVAKINPMGTAFCYATFLGGNAGDHVLGISLDGTGNAYVTGETRSSDFPTTVGAFDTTFSGGYYDVFVAKLNSVGGTLEYSTFLGGDQAETGSAITVDSAGNAHIIGITNSEGFPTTAEAYDTTFNGSDDVFVVKLNSAGSALEYSTFLGGQDDDGGQDISLDGSGNVHVAGETGSSDFPTTAGAFDEMHNGFYDVFIAKLNPTGGVLDYCTFLGGNDDDYGSSISLDGFANAYVTGETRSSDFPTTAEAFDTTLNGSSDIFVAQLNEVGNDLNYSTYLGGNSIDIGLDISVDHAGNAYLTGETVSADFPTTAGAFDEIYNGVWDALMVKLNSTGSAIEYSTFLGGNDYEGGRGIFLDGFGNAYVTGETYSSDFPVTSGAFDTTLNGYSDVFVAKLSLGSTVVESGTPLAVLPKACTLHQNYPNPFNASSEIRYTIPKDSHVILKIFNTLGQEVRTLADTDQKAGSQTTSWDGRDREGREAASGLYFCRLQAGDFAKTIKMVLLK
jgi:hypothetical protein